MQIRITGSREEVKSIREYFLSANFPQLHVGIIKYDLKSTVWTLMLECPMAYFKQHFMAQSPTAPRRIQLYVAEYTHRPVDGEVLIVNLTDNFLTLDQLAPSNNLIFDWEEHSFEVRGYTFMKDANGNYSDTILIRVDKIPTFTA